MKNEVKCPWCNNKRYRGRPAKRIPRRLRFIINITDREFGEMLKGKEYLVQQEPVDPVRYDYYLRVAPHKRNTDPSKRRHEYEDAVYLRAIASNFDLRALEGALTS